MTWSPATTERALALVARYPEPRSAVMPLLFLAMHEEGRLTDEGMRRVAELTGLTPVQVQSVASFYSMYKEEVGRHVVSVCTSISCMLLGGEDVLAGAAEEAGIRPGETDPDGRVTVERVECIGACGGAPAVQVDYELIEGVSRQQVRALVRWLLEERPEVISGDDLQERFGGARSFEPGSPEPEGASGPVPAFGPYGTAAEGEA